MQNFVTVFLQVLTLFLLILAGYVLGKFKLIDDATSKGMTNIVLYAATPAAIIISFADETRTADKSINLLIVFTAALAIHFMSFLLVKPLVKNDDDSVQCVLRFAVIFSNCGYMSFPLQKALLGEIGVFYGSMYVAVFNIFMWTFGILLISGDKKYCSLKNILLNPTIISVIVAVAIYMYNIKIPHFLYDGLIHLSNLNTPLPMIIVGYYLSTASLKAAFTDKRVIVPCSLKLVFIPLISILGMRLIGISGIPLTACAVAVSAPTAAATTMLSSKFNKNISVGVNNIAVSTILSIITMPLFVMFSQL